MTHLDIEQHHLRNWRSQTAVAVSGYTPTCSMAPSRWDAKAVVSVPAEHKGINKPAPSLADAGHTWVMVAKLGCVAPSPAACVSCIACWCHPG